MTIGTTMFTTLSIQGFSRLDAEIGALQEQISSGKNDPRPSTDLGRAVQLSALTDQRSSLDRFDSNLGNVLSRLANTDSVLEEMGTTTIRLQELATRAASDTSSADDRLAIRAEAVQLRLGLTSLANSKDSIGQNLFGGYRSEGVVFGEDALGVISYLGDTGNHSLRVSETLRLPTGIDGATAFMDIDTDTGSQSLFGIVDEFIDALGHDTLQNSQNPALSNLEKAVGHLIVQRTRAGAISSVADTQAARISDRKLSLEKSVSGLEDADIAQVITRLQALLINREASQATFAKISKQSLFDYLR